MTTPTPPTNSLHAVHSAPSPGTLVMDVSRRWVGIFRCEIAGRWELAPVAGGDVWTVAPSETRPTTAMERLHAVTARVNARSRGEVS
nr:hypothetical protein [Streptomyces catenulae]